MKFSIEYLAVISLTGFGIQSDAFHAGLLPTSNFRRWTKLEAIRLEDWQLLDNGSLVGAVKDHPTLLDGVVITTSPLSDLNMVVAANCTVQTTSGSEYTLGSPLEEGDDPRKTRAIDSRYYFGSGSSSNDDDVTINYDDEPTIDRLTMLQKVGIGSLVAGGCFSFGLGLGGIGGGKDKMTIPEVG